MAWTKAKTPIFSAVIVGMATLSVIQHQAQVKLREQIQILQQEQTPLAKEIRQLQREQNDATNRLAGLTDDLAKANSNNLELLKLRGEATLWRQESEELARLKSSSMSKDEVESVDKSCLDRVRLLKERLEQTPEAKNPELQFLTEDIWLQAAKHKLDTDEDYRAAFEELRANGERNFLRAADTALRNYMGTNNGVLPTDFLQLKPYFENPPADELLQHYQNLMQRNNPDSK